MKKIKEAGQYTLDGEVIDSFYDDNKVYKAIEKRIAPIVKPMEKAKLKIKLRDIGETIFDYIQETYGGVPSDTNVDNFIEKVFTDDEDFYEEIWVEKVLSLIIEAINDEAKSAEEYYKENYWDDNSYIALESTPDERSMEIGNGVYEVLEDLGLSTDDLIEFISDEVTSDDLNSATTYMRAYNEKYSVTVWSSPIGEMEHQLNDDLIEALESLYDDDIRYIMDKIETYLKGNYIYINLSYDVINYYFTWKDIEDKFEEWLEKTGKANLKVGASVSSGYEDFIKENAIEEGIEIDWTVLNKEVAEYEMTVVSFLRKSKNYTNVIDEGHDRNDDLAISFEVTDKNLIEEYKELIDREGRFSFTDPSHSADSDLFKAVNKLISKSKFLHLCDLQMALFL